MSAGFLDPVILGVAFAALAAGFLWKRALRGLAFIGVDSPVSIMGSFLTVCNCRRGVNDGLAGTYIERRRPSNACGAKGMG